jgi:hypothetical protein
LRTLSILLSVGFLILIPVGRSLADQVPSLDVKKSCREAEDFGATTDAKQTYKSCMQDENEAKAQLQQKWSQFKPKSRHSCIPAAPSPSYVEMLTCLEMNQDALLPYSAGGGVGLAAPGMHPHDSPSPRPPMSPGPRGFQHL